MFLLRNCMNTIKLRFHVHLHNSLPLFHDPATKTKHKTLKHVEMIKKLREEKLRKKGLLKPVHRFKQAEGEPPRRRVFKLLKKPRIMQFVRSFYLKNKIDLIKLYTETDWSPETNPRFDRKYWIEYNDENYKLEKLVDDFKKSLPALQESRKLALSNIRLNLPHEYSKIVRLRKKQIHHRLTIFFKAPLTVVGPQSNPIDSSESIDLFNQDKIDEIYPENGQSSEEKCQTIIQ
ncbi:hypothetical protein RF11_08677 [Thelohanellus kitauei]|uniref:Uncharacterized protein n=1 Tax=Thelohanellus kitauei TaxID=669202 RepID=A0A0C2JS50_THEKT|nr:hypothetical protein RF11_08677 [Thelohanellus kitauei]